MLWNFPTKLLLTASLGLAAPETAEPTKAEAPTGDIVSTTGSTLGVELQVQSFTLDNGLKVVVHEDRKAPVVAVQVMYGVGSKDEPQGKTGFAHLFEHLMFMGTRQAAAQAGLRKSPTPRQTRARWVASAMNGRPAV